MKLQQSDKPYQALGIGDVVALGMVSGHTFVFKPVSVEVPESHPDQQWLSRWHEHPDLPVGLVVSDNHAYMDCVANMSLVQAKVSLRMNAVQCAELAALLLNAAMVLETQAQAELAELDADKLAQAEAGSAA